MTCGVNTSRPSKCHLVGDRHALLSQCHGFRWGRDVDGRVRCPAASRPIGVVGFLKLVLFLEGDGVR